VSGFKSERCPASDRNRCPASYWNNRPASSEIALEGLRGEESIAELCRREGIATSMYYAWSKEFLEADKRRLTGDTA
jgi:hypothetical protein